MSTFKQQSDLKFHNRLGVYETIRNYGQVSRIQLAKITGLSATSMTRMIAGLTELGLVREVTQKSSNPSGNSGNGGRPSVLLVLCAEKAYSLNIDMEGSCLRASIMDLAHRFVVYRELIIAPRSDSFHDVAGRIRDVFQEMISYARIPEKDVKCCGLTLGAHVSAANGAIVASSQFKWYDVEAKIILENMLHMPVIVENDCKAALYGERILLAANGKNSDNIAYLEMGSDGVGSAVIIDGHLLRGSFNAAGEIGHITVLPDGEICNCGRRGCFETVMTENFVLKRTQLVHPEYKTLEKVAAAIRRNDINLIALMDELSDYIAIAINDISCAYNPEIVILNGPVIQKNAVNLKSIETHMEKRLLRTIQPHLEVTVARMGAHASLYGIGCLATENVVSELLRG